MSAALAYPVNDARPPRAANDNAPFHSTLTDSLGNLREKKLGSRTVTLTYDSARNRLSQSVDTGASGTRTVAYDHRGNVTTLGTLAFVYDKSDQPTAVTGTANGVGAANGTYRYDGNPCILRICRHRNWTNFVHFLWRFYCVNANCTKRVKSIINGQTIYNVYDASGALVQIDKATDGEVTDYVTGPTGTLARITNDVVTYLHPDHLGSAQAGTRANGTVAWREQYTPFGEQLQNPAANDNLGGFTGHIKDSATGLNPCIFPSENCTVQARYYDPVIGRFLSIDPMTMLDMDMNPDYFNRYSYSANDPINRTDPSGESWVHAAKFAYGAVIGGVSGTTSGSLVNGSEGAKAGGLSGAIAGGLTSVAGVKSPGLIAGVGSIGGQLGSQVDRNISAGSPAAANLKLDVPVTLGGAAAAQLSKNPVKGITKIGTLPKNIQVPYYVDTPVADIARTLPGASVGAGLEGLASGSGELAGAFVGDQLESRGTPTNISITDETGKLDLGWTFSDRNK